MNDPFDLIRSTIGISALARQIGISRQAIHLWQRAGQIPAEYVVAIEAATGIPREMLRPDLFCFLVDEEEWRAIPDFPGYEASSTGMIRRGSESSHGQSKPHVGNVLKAHPQPNGDYLTVHLYRDAMRFTVNVHVLVCSAFNGSAPTSIHEVAHWNNNRTDNRPANLRWVTRAENHHDKIRHGTSHRGWKRDGRGGRWLKPGV